MAIVARMPLTARFKYTNVTGKLLDLLRRAPDVGRPKKVTPAWLNSIGCASSDPNSIIRVLRFVELIGGDDSPTDLWETIRAPSRENRIRFAKAVRKAYADLFQFYPDAHRKDDKALETFFKGQEIGGKEVQALVLKTFRALTLFGDFDSGLQSPTDSVIDMSEFVKSVEALESEAQRLIATFAAAQTRIEALEPIPERLSELSLEQDLVLWESLRAAEAGLFKASHVLAWSEFADYLGKLVTSMVAERRWSNDATLINIARDLHIYTEQMKTTLHSLLVDRNQCAHATGYHPTLSDTVAFLNKVISMMEKIQRR